MPSGPGRVRKSPSRRRATSGSSTSPVDSSFIASGLGASRQGKDPGVAIRRLHFPRITAKAIDFATGRLRIGAGRPVLEDVWVSVTLNFARNPLAKDPRDRFKKKNRPERAWSEKDPATQRERDKPGYAYPVTSGHCPAGTTEKVDCWPMPEVPNNIDMTVGNLQLTDQEEDQIVAFLQTLTDGFTTPYADINTYTGACMQGGSAKTQGNAFLIPTPPLQSCASAICGIAPLPGPNPIP